jgi:hypothetical protein
MKIKLRKIALAAFAASVLTVSAGRSFAEDLDHRLEAHEHDKDSKPIRARADGEHFNRRKQATDLKAARDKLTYDNAHHASRKQLAEDDAAITQIESNMRVAHRR